MRRSFRWLLVGVSLLVASVVEGAGDPTPISGGSLTIEDAAYSRALPHAFYDQAMASLPHLYPRHQLLASRRAAVLGDLVYALVCYKETPSSGHAVIEAVAVFRDRAWNIRAITSASYGDGLVEVLEHIAALPSRRDVQPTPESGHR